MKRVSRWLLGVASLLGSGMAAACAICAPSELENTVVQRLLAADVAVIARAAPDGSGYQAVQAIKGHQPKGVIKIQDAAARVSAPVAGQTDLLVYSGGSQTWRKLGLLGSARAQWARTMLEIPRAAAPSTPDPAWEKRLQFFAPDLESPEPLVAQAAYEEISVAPYAAMRGLKARLDAQKLNRWLDNPALQARHPLYGLLLGMAASAAQIGALEQRLAATSGLPGNTATLSALLAATLEVRGNAGVDWIERNYLSGPSGDNRRSDAEIQAALLALNVHGNDGVRVDRDRVVQAYALFIQNHGAMAGLVASDLSAWGRWEFGPAYFALLQSQETQSFASRYAMVFYLMRSPRPEARTALEALRASGAL
ncbi:MAG: hypothetical protein RIR45_980 [Pseudomonadota bacterium]|jgi:hypothetical protein